MSEFDGHLIEYPFISIDKFTESNFSSSVYFLSHYHLDHIEGLLDQPFLQRLQCGHPHAKLYTSETTLSLMHSDPNAADILPFVIGLPIHQHTSINLLVDQSEEGKEESVVSEDFVVTLIAAGHCVGSVMFLFEGSKGAVLFTGDFRLRKEDIMKVPCLHSGSKVIELRSMYVDTTFLCPNMPMLPSREQTKDAIISIIQSWIKKGDHHVVHLKCKGKYGYEYIMKEIAQHFNTKIHVNQWRMEMSSKLTDMLKHFTTDKTSTQIHCCYYGKKSTGCNFTLPCGVQTRDGKLVKVRTIVPSSMYFMLKGMPDDWKVNLRMQNLWRVVHSMHASYNEIRDVVGYLHPRNIYPFVPPVDCQDIWVAYQRLKDLESKGSSKSALELSSSTNLIDATNNGLCWKESLRTKSTTITGKESRDDLLGLCSTKNELGSPPPKKKRKRLVRNKSDTNSKVDRGEGKSHDKDYDRIIMEAFESFSKNNTCTGPAVVDDEKNCQRTDEGKEPDIDELLEEGFGNSKNGGRSVGELIIASHNQNTRAESKDSDSPHLTSDPTEYSRADEKSQEPCKCSNVLEINGEKIRTTISNDNVSRPLISVDSTGSSAQHGDNKPDVVVIGSSSSLGCGEVEISDSLDTLHHLISSKTTDEPVVVSDTESTDSDRTLSLNGSFLGNSQEL